MILPLVIAALVGAVISYLLFTVPAQRKAARAEGRLDADQKDHGAHFAQLAAEALGKNSESFLQLVSERFETHKLTADKDLEGRHQAIEALIKPLGESLAKYEHRVGEIEKERASAYSAITEQVKSLAEGQTDLRSETGRLVQALRRPTTRGRWGEHQLRNVLELAGMTAHVDFFEQQSIGEANQLRPDAIVRLPKGGTIIVDAKTPLEAYLNAVETSNEDERERFMADHARQVSDHVRNLAAKDYWEALPTTPDFVVMFIPGEAFFAAALERSPDLFETAIHQRIVLSSPSNLIALLRTIAYGWRQQKLAENAQEVAGLGRKLFERVKVFGDHMSSLGQTLQQTVDHYNKGVGSLERRLLPAARKFEDLGVVAAGSAIPTLDPVELEVRKLQAEELEASPLKEGEAAD
ncbi:MAG: DNA recombination protein RmuC [Truepera sp.]|nr:DNA recombination protein RmuC [Truepera sp.]